MFIIDHARLFIDIFNKQQNIGSSKFQTIFNIILCGFKCRFIMFKTILVH